MPRVALRPTLQPFDGLGANAGPLVTVTDPLNLFRADLSLGVELQLAGDGRRGAGSVPDGIGDACQCGDVNGDGRVTVSDAALVQRSLLSPPTATLPRPERCNVGGASECTVSDAVILRRALLSPPTATIQQVCGPAT